MAETKKLNHAMLVGLLVGWALGGCGGEPPPAAEAPAAALSPPLETPEPVREAAEEGSADAQPASSKGFLGVVVTRDTVNVAAETQGRVESVAVQVGDRVRPGDLLARLDTRDMAQDLGMSRSSLRAAQAEVSRIESQVQEAATRYERRKNVEDLFSREELEAARMEHETALATLEAAKARVSEQETQVEQLQTRLQRAEIRAPFGGTVALRYLDPGATVLAGTPVVRLLSTEELVVRFAVPPDDVEALHLGDAVEVALGDAGIRASATIRHIAPEIDGPSQMVFVEAQLEASDELTASLRSGLVARVFHS